MRKYLRYAHVIVMATGILGMLLMSWLFAGGTDERGLYPARHPGWVLTGILTVLVIAATWLLTRQAGTNRNYQANFPASLPSALGYALAAIALLVQGFTYLRTASGILYLLAGVVGIASGIGLLMGAMNRLRGQRTQLPPHMLPCFFFALNLFVLGQKFGSEPELCRYLYRFWAVGSMVPACYHLWGFDVGMGKRINCLFWCLLAGYCNLVTAVGNEQQFMYLAMGIWMLTALPKLGYLPKQPRTPRTEEVIPAAEESAVANPVFDIPATDLPKAESSSMRPELEDPEAILEQLLREFGQQDT